MEEAMTDRMFPVLWQGDRAYLARLAELECPREIEWAIVEQYREACLRNHSQTPERLAERGGLSPAEREAGISSQPSPLADLLEMALLSGSRRETKKVPAVIQPNSTAPAK